MQVGQGGSPALAVGVAHYVRFHVDNGLQLGFILVGTDIYPTIYHACLVAQCFFFIGDFSRRSILCPVVQHLFYIVVILTLVQHGKVGAEAVVACFHVVLVQRVDEVRTVYDVRVVGYGLGSFNFVC